MWERLAGSPLYLDANAIIYAVETGNRFTASLHDLFTTLDAGVNVAITSELTLAEVLVRPLAMQADNLVFRYERLLSGEGPIGLAPVTPPILRRAAQIRADTRLKLIDAIHVATAVELGCHVLVSNDAPLARALPGTIRWVSPMGPS
jgi:predicted nucleic acid-binding protein